jgi:alpha-tubulin suppressor-like RCC1 family protein
MGGSVQCWGYNYNSQLGDGTTTNSPIAVTASEITNAVAISTGSTFSCALLSDGSIKCWGNNYYGQLGDGTTTNQTTPATVSNVTSAVAISSGPDFSCALLSNGSMKCWGSNYSGQLGDGTTTNRSTPVPVSNITNAVAIAAGGINWVQHSCAVLSTGAVQCWGDKGDYKPNLVPVAVPGISSATAVAVSGLTGGGTGWQIHACALLSDRTVQCWGQNESGELGNGTTLTSSVPVTVTGITTARAIAAGYGDACAVLEDNTIKCWGNNDTGQLGNGTMDSSATPVQVVGF